MENDQNEKAIVPVSLVYFTVIAGLYTLVSHILN